MTSMPSYPSGPEYSGDAVTPRTAPPAEVLLSVKLWFASILVGLLGGILVFALTDQDEAVQALLDADSGLTEADVQTAVTIGLVVALVLALILLALQVFFVLKMKAGRNWARIVLTVLGALSVLSSLTSFTQALTAGSLISFASTILLVAAIVFMYRPAASAYFARPQPV